MDLMDSNLLELIRARRIELEAAAALGRDDERAQQLEGSFIDFVEAAWPALDPAEYQSCWAIDALCEHLQAVLEGQIRHLLVNAPPRCSKTTIASIFFPAWTWAQSQRTFLKGPQVRFLCGSYNHDLSLTNIAIRHDGSFLVRGISRCGGIGLNSEKIRTQKLSLILQLAVQGLQRRSAARCLGSGATF
jgi:hypothetical protein